MITDNLRMYLDTLTEQNIYYCAIFKEYGDLSHRGYLRGLSDVISTFRRHLQSEDPIGGVEGLVERIKKFVKNLETDLSCLKLMQPNSLEEYEEDEAYIDKLTQIKNSIEEILRGED